MNRTILEFICENDDIELRNEIRNHVSKKFYKNIKSQKSLILVNDVPMEGYKTIKKGDKIRINYELTNNIDWELYDSILDIHYEDEHYLIVNKRAGLLSIPTKSEPYSLYQEVLFYLKQTNQNLNVSILNRLDKETSGLCVIAKDRLAAYYLQPTHEHMIRKYKCLCKGLCESDNGKIETFINKEVDSHKRYVSLTNGKKAISYYKVLNRLCDKTLFEFVLDTGRTHQIRLHSIYIGHPIVGDSLYDNDNFNELHLCSYYVEFMNKFNNELIKCEIKPNWE